MKRIIAIAAVPLMLGGCLPLPVTIASTAISGISYLTTGKSSTDHVISAAVEQDCALTRPIIGEAVCKDIDPNSSEASERVVVSAYPGDRDDGGFPSMRDPNLRKGAMKLDELPQGPAQVAVALPFAGLIRQPIETPGLVASEESAAPLPQGRPIKISAPARAWTPPEPVERLEIAPVVTATVGTASDEGTVIEPEARPVVSDASRYVVIGSLRDASRARLLADRFASLSADVRQVEISGRTWNRVVVGPFAPGKARLVKAELGTVEGKEPWIVRLQPRAEQIAMR